jgi:AraC-like DNA-binding protein
VAQLAPYTATLLNKSKPRNRVLLDSAGFGCAGAIRSLDNAACAGRGPNLPAAEDGIGKPLNATRKFRFRPGIGVGTLRRGFVVTNTFIAHRTARLGVVRVEATLTDFAFPAHSHDHVCIGLVRSGEHDCRYGLRRHTVSQGDLMLVNPGEVHDGRPSGWCGRRYTMLEVDPDALRAICRDTLATEWIEFSHAVVRDPRASAALSAWLDALVGADPLAERDASALVFGSLAERADRGPRPSAGNDLAARAVSRMREDYAAADGIGAIAAEAGVSHYALIRAFKRRFGLSPEDVRRQLRIERARVLLAGSAPLVDIAAESGFADQSHMTRELRRLIGISPAAYRRALQ